MHVEPDITIKHTDPLTYRTQDRGLAAAFMALGFQFLRLEPADRGATFLFAVSQELLDAADAYLVDALAISARRIALAMEQLNELVSEPDPVMEVDLDAL